MPEVALSAGIIEYEDTGGNGPVVVLLHGLAMDSSLWRHVVRELRDEYRCVVPTLPVGAHRRPMRPDADLTPRGVARLVGELLERLDLRDVTLVENDHGHAQRLVGERPERVARLVLASCEAFDNYPPGLPGRTVAFAARLPGGLNALVQPLRLRRLRRLPFAFGWMAKRPIPDEVTDAWLRPLLTRREIRGDLARYLRAVKKGDMLAAAERLRSFDRPALVVWAADRDLGQLHSHPRGPTPRAGCRHPAVRPGDAVSAPSRPATACPISSSGTRGNHPRGCSSSCASQGQAPCR